MPILRSSPSGTAPRRRPSWLLEQRLDRLGVTSRPVKPVPPVVMTTSIAGDSIIPARPRIASMSSGTMVRSITKCGRLDAIESVVPDLSSAIWRVSKWSAPRTSAARTASRRSRASGLHGQDKLMLYAASVAFRRSTQLCVIRGRLKPSPESITPAGDYGFGLLAALRPRNDHRWIVAASGGPPIGRLRISIRREIAAGLVAAVP